MSSILKMGVVASFFAVIATFVTAQTKEQVLRQYIDAKVSGPYTLQASSLKFKDFPSENGGRLSAIGTLRLTVDLLDMVKRIDSVLGYPGWQNLERAITAKGYSITEFQSAIRSLGFGKNGSNSSVEYVILHPKGTEIPFEAELPYIETVSGFSLSGKVSYRPLEGKPNNRATMPGYIVGTAGFQTMITRVVNQIEYQRAETRGRASDIVNFFKQEFEVKSRATRPSKLTLDIQASDNDLASWVQGSSDDSRGPASVFRKSLLGQLAVGDDFRLGDYTLPADSIFPVRVTLEIPETGARLEKTTFRFEIQAATGWIEVTNAWSPFRHYQSGFQGAYVDIIPSSGVVKPSPQRTAVAGNPLDKLRSNQPQTPQEASHRSVEGAGESDADFQSYLLGKAWSGPVNQGGRVTYSVTADPSSGRFEIAYPELQCGGTWTFVSVVNDTAELREAITYGSRCGNGGSITLKRRSDGSVDFEYWDFQKRRRCCFAVLTSN